MLSREIRGSKSGLLIRPAIFQQMQSNFQVDRTDIQTQACNNLKLIFVDQDHLTQFLQLRALKSKHAEEVVYNLIDILLYLHPQRTSK